MVSVATNTDLKGLVHSHVPAWSPRHPMIPKRYVMAWKQDMENRKMLLKIVERVKLHKGPEEDSLFLENRERLCHGEERESIKKKSKKQEVSLIDVPLYSHLSRHRSSVKSWTCRLEGRDSQKA
ncbi:testis-expressed protein 43 [Rhinatrema bivittatum]|uniref:testis-expressed protein 43 n=1 Tax=Rhinatrema bivittatum TaxID=194408 RepID=UPI0011286278|nr:testis-expressed protein 43 [Rhinatrema bivittatum]